MSSQAGARGIERFAASDCERYRTITASGDRLDHVAKRVYDLTVRGVSPLAAEIGIAFERSLFAGDAGIVRQLFSSTHRQAAAAELVDFGERRDDGYEAKATALTTEWLSSAPDHPVVLAQARLELPIGERSQSIRPDLVTYEPDRGSWRIGEVKAILCREGETDKAGVGGACRQAAVGILAARATVEMQEAPASSIDDSIDLFLRNPSPAKACVHTLRVDGEVAAIAAGVAELAARGGLARFDGEEVIKALVSPREVEQIPHLYRPSCIGSCPLAGPCRAEALRRQDTGVVSDKARELLGDAATLDSAISIAVGEMEPADDIKLPASLVAAVRAGYAAVTT